VLNIEGIGSIGAYARTDIRNPFVCALLRRDRDSHSATIDSILSDQKKYQQLSKKYAQWETESRRVATLAGSEELADDNYRRDYTMSGTDMAKHASYLMSDGLEI
jgi:hypothetical protein